MVRVLINLHQAAVSGATAGTGNRLRHDIGRGVRSHVSHLGARVLELVLTSKGNGENLTLGVRTGHPYGRVLHGDLGANVAVDPFHGAAFFYLGALGHQVVDVAGPVLNGGVAAAAALLHDDLHYCGVQGIRLVDRSGTALDVVNISVLVDDDEGALELAHIFRVDAEISLQWNVYVHALGHVDKGATGPHSGVQRGKLIVTGRDNGAEVLLEKLRVVTQCGISIDEDNALAFQVLTDLVVDNLGLVLGCHTGNEALLLSLWNAQLIVGGLDVVREVFPGLGLLLSGLHVVLNLVEVDARQIRTPGGNGLLIKDVECLQALVKHPFRLALLGGNIAYYIFVQAAASRSTSRVRVVPAVLICTNGINDFIIGHLVLGCRLCLGHDSLLSVFVLTGVKGMFVVQIP